MFHKGLNFCFGGCLVAALLVGCYQQNQIPKLEKTQERAVTKVQTDKEPVDCSPQQNTNYAGIGDEQEWWIPGQCQHVMNQYQGYYLDHDRHIYVHHASQGRGHEMVIKK